MLIEVANEQDIDAFKIHPIAFYPEGMASLIDLAREESGGIPTGCSSRGRIVYPDIAAVSDYILIHGNNHTRTGLYNLVQQAREYSPGRPVVCDEDS